MTTPEDLVRNFYGALATGDIPAILELLDDDLEWTEAERFPYYGGTWHRPQAVIENLLMPIERDWEGFSIVLEDLIARENRVVSFGRYSGTYKETGRFMSAPFAHSWAARGGRLSHFAQYTDTAKVLEALRPSTRS